MLCARLIPAACLLAAASCSMKTPRAPAASLGGVKVAMDRQVRIAHEVRNAVDAGEGDFEARQLRERLVANAGDLDTRLRLGARYEELDMPELAIEHYRLAAERFPTEVLPQIRLARAMHRKGRTAEGAVSLENYLAAYPEAPAEAHSWAGILRDALGHHKVAEHHHRDALERSGAAAYLRNNLGENLTLQAREPEAASEFRAALALEPANVFARNNLAVLLIGNPSEAAKVLEAGTDDPATAHSNLAALLIDQARYGEARKELNLALGYKPDHAPALANLALVADLDGKPAQVPVKNSAPSFQSRIGRAFARVFTHSETRYPEQTASVTHPAAKGKGKKPSD
jgi:tetratricopeptide (TPR) repeat protein